MTRDTICYKFIVRKFSFTNLRHQGTEEATDLSPGKATGRHHDLWCSLHTGHMSVNTRCNLLILAKPADNPHPHFILIFFHCTWSPLVSLPAHTACNKLIHFTMPNTLLTNHLWCYNISYLHSCYLCHCNITFSKGCIYTKSQCQEMICLP